jgi:hypothetical protein
MASETPVFDAFTRLARDEGVMCYLLATVILMCLLVGMLLPDSGLAIVALMAAIFFVGMVALIATIVNERDVKD